MASFAQASDLKAWQALQEHHNSQGRNIVLKEVFQQDPDRFQKFSHTFNNTADKSEILFDFSKNFLTEETLKLLVDLAKEAGVEKLRDAMFAGEKINFTEKRAVYHVALRNVAKHKMEVDGKSVVEDTHSVLEHMKDFSEQIRSGSWKGFTGKPLTTIINIGIGGSDLYENHLYQWWCCELTSDQWSCDGVGGIEAIRRAEDEAPLCLQYRRDAYC
jgi:glucose-6-phosphate isomerase